MFTIIILTIVFYVLRIISNKFTDNIHIKKLLGASFGQIANPFNALLGGVICAGFVVMFFLIIGLDLYLKTHDFSMLFFVDIFSLGFLPDSFSSFLIQPRYVLGAEWVALLVISFFINNWYLQKTILKAGN